MHRNETSESAKWSRLSRFLGELAARLGPNDRVRDKVTRAEADRIWSKACRQQDGHQDE